MTMRLEPIYENVLLEGSESEWSTRNTNTLTSQPSLRSVTPLPSNSTSRIRYIFKRIIEEFVRLGYNIRRMPTLHIKPTETDPFCSNGENGEKIIHLHARANNWDCFVYEFAHEFCHYVINGPLDGRLETSFWFEESICELASCYVLHELGECKHQSTNWKLTPPPSEISFEFKDELSKACIAYFKYEINRFPKISGTLSQWINNNKGLEERIYRRELYGIIAKSLLPLFLEHPNLWKILPYLKRVDQNTYRDFPHWIKQVIKPQLPTDLSEEFELLENMLVG